MNEWRIVGEAFDVSGTAIGDGRWRVRTTSKRGVRVARAQCDTSFPRDLIELLLRTTEPQWICDAIARHEDPAYVTSEVCSQLLAHFPQATYSGKRFLDFGCGNGASTMAMAALLPETEVIGVELSPVRVAEANAILSHRRLQNVRFLLSPSGGSLPPGLGEFDFVMLSAVFEHLLPHERTTVMPLIWSHMRPGGVIFINQTPYRWHPYEHHSSGLWAINYLPARAAWWVASRYGGRTRHKSWEEMLRGGIRGGTERSVRVALTNGHLERAETLTPTQNGLRSRADYWLARTSPRYRPLKKIIAAGFGLLERTLGTVPALNISVAFRKRA
jgi:2-polyprenyl-3-methyl-5-hydroxy-6-metoxy-1,4-benzoquinol methylase